VETALKDMGFNIDLNHIHSPLTVLKSWLKRDAFGDTYVRGTSRLKKFLLEQGVRIVESDDAKTVVFGWDAEIDLRAMSIATKAILDRGARFIALHENRLYRDQQGYPCPGVGAFVRAIEYATGVQAEIVGKPSILYFQYALERLGVSPDNSVMVGDDPFGDLTGAKKTGMKTVLVLTGKYKNSKILEKLPSALKPDLVLENISSLSQEYFP
jgi:4-nitrophenyl phosphatase